MSRSRDVAFTASLLVLLVLHGAVAAPRVTAEAPSFVPDMRLAASLTHGPTPQPSPSDTAALRRLLEGHAAAFRGVAGISLRNLATGENLSIRGHETFPSASLIKVPVLVALLDEVNRGRIALDERSSLVSRDRVGGSGVLRMLQPGIAPSMEDLAWLMITISDNTATNMILDKIDVRTVWTKMEALGLPHSKVHSKTFRRETSLALDSSVIYGLGVATPDETVRLFTLLHEGAAVSPPLDSLAVRMLLANQDDAMLTRWLPAGTRVAHKSGSVDRARNDCGIMYTPAAPVALCVMTRENEDTSYAVDNPAHLLVARVARDVFAHYNPGVALPGPAAGLVTP
jgi:beta-lactamase class A